MAHDKNGPLEHRVQMTQEKIDRYGKLNGDWEFLQVLRRFGREAADRFLERHFAQIGRESTLDIQRYL